MRQCSACQHRYEERLVAQCPFCEAGLPLRPARLQRPWLAAVLSAFLFGAGQFYNKRLARGILVFLGVATGVFGLWYGGIRFAEDRMAGADLMLAGGVVAFPVWVFSVVDAWADAREINSGLGLLMERNPRVAGLLNLLPRAWGFGYVYLGHLRAGVGLFAAGFALHWAAAGWHLPWVSAALLVLQAGTAVDAYRRGVREIQALEARYARRLAHAPGTLWHPWVLGAGGLLLVFQAGLVLLVLAGR